MFQYDAANTGHAPEETGPKADPAELWRLDLGGDVRASPAVADGAVYVGHANGLSAIDARTGSGEWEFETDEAIASSPAVADGTVYAPSEEGTLYALDATDGTERWSRAISSETVASPTVANEAVIVPADSRLVALDRSGTEITAFDAVGPVTSPVAVAGGSVYAVTEGGTTYALGADPLSGVLSETWSAEVAIDHSNIDSTPSVTVDGDTLYVCGNDPSAGSQGRLYALDPDDGAERWSFTRTGHFNASPAVTGTAVYVVGDYGSVYSVDAADGTERWQFDATTDGAIPFLDDVNSAPVVVDGTVYVGSDDNTAYAIRADTGTERWSFDTGGDVVAAPAVVDGIAFVGSTDGTMRAIASADSAPPSLRDGLSAPGGSGGSDSGLPLVPGALSLLGFGAGAWALTRWYGDGSSTGGGGSPEEGGEPGPARGGSPGSSTGRGSDGNAGSDAAPASDTGDADWAESEIEGLTGTSLARSGDRFETYVGTLSGADADGAPVRIRALAADVDVADGLAWAFDRVAGEWYSASTHPNVATVLEWDEEPRPWIAVRSRSGADRLSDVRDDLSVEDAVAAVTDAAEAVRNAALYNASHHDLTPDCVWIDPHGTTVTGLVADWGLERVVRDHVDGERVTAYTAPEQLPDAGKSPDGRTDVYGLGAVAYDALTARPPVADDPDAIRGGDVAPPSAVADVPSELDDPVLRALATDPAERFDSAYDFQRALQRSV